MAPQNPSGPDHIFISKVLTDKRAIRLEKGCHNLTQLFRIHRKLFKYRSKTAAEPVHSGPREVLQAVAQEVMVVGYGRGVKVGHPATWQFGSRLHMYDGWTRPGLVHKTRMHLG
jgi:hypothetical protein